MVRKFVIGLGMALSILAISQLIGLGFLLYGLKTYDDYWRGRANRPGDFIYVALGDSAAQSVGASRPSKGYVGLLAAQIEQSTGRSVRVINLSRSGATLQEAVREQAPKLADYKADLVTVEMGANDMRGYNPATFARDYERLLQALPPGQAVVSEMPYFGGRAHQNRNARDANLTIHRLAQTYSTPVAPLYESLRQQQSPWIYAADLFHPNDRGYKIWSDAFWPSALRIVGQPKDI